MVSAVPVGYVPSPLSVMVIVATLEPSVNPSSSCSTTDRDSELSTLESSVMTTSTHTLEVPVWNVISESEREKSPLLTPSVCRKQRERERESERERGRGGENKVI